MDLHHVYLSLGSNLGDKHSNLQSAISAIEENVGRMTHISSVYETKPWGFDSPNYFLNLVLEVETNLSPWEVLKETQEIEIRMGRNQKNSEVYQDRIIDIDMLFYDQLILRTKILTLPHPRMHLRSFVMDPLKEIAPEMVEWEMKIRKNNEE